MSRNAVRYTEDEGEMDGLGERLPDFLPSPDQLVPRQGSVRVTVSLDPRSLAFFERLAAERGLPSDRLIAAVIDAYAEGRR
jgi:hypothetical protein